MIAKLKSSGATAVATRTAATALLQEVGFPERTGSRVAKPAAPVEIRKPGLKSAATRSSVTGRRPVSIRSKSILLVPPPSKTTAGTKPGKSKTAKTKPMAVSIRAFSDAVEQHDRHSRGAEIEADSAVAAHDAAAHEAKVRSIADLLAGEDEIENDYLAGDAGLDFADELEPELSPEQARLELIKAEKIARQAAAKARAWELASLQSDPVLARRDQVVLEHLPLVKAIAVRVHENLPVHVDLDDLVHAGILGLFDAASKFNPEKQVAFSSYAKHRIKGAILDSLRQLDWASRDMRRRHKQLEAATRDLAAKLQRNPTEAEVAEKLGMDPERWRSMMLDLRNVGLISASTRANENEDLPAPDFPSKPDTHPDSICAHEQLRGVLGVAIKTLPERYQKVVSLYYSGEMTMKEIGGMLGINESRVSQIHKSALEKMQVVLESNGITNAQAF